MPEILSNSLGMEMVLLPAGAFTMGGDWDREQADENELPRHTVTFDNVFYLARHPVTQAQWQALMGNNPSEFTGGDHPVEMVSHEDACAYIARLNASENTRSYRLPTEAEWEYAARAGSQSTYCYGPDIGRLGDFAWFQANSGGRTHPVGRKAANQWGLYDMHGHVHEWCADWYARDYYAASPGRHPGGPRHGVARVLRGGDWGSDPWYCRCAVRSLSSPQRRSPRVGFRIVKDRGEATGRPPAPKMMKKIYAAFRKQELQ